MARKKRKPPHSHHQAQPTPAVAAEAPWPTRPRFTHAQVAAIVGKHLVPLVALWLFGGSAENFLLVSVFTIALAVVGMGLVGVAVSTRQTQGQRGTADTLAALGVLVVVGTIGTLLLTAMFGWVIVLVIATSPQGLWNAALGWAVLAVLLAALPDMVMQYRTDLAANQPEDVRRKRDQLKVGGLVLSAGMLFVLSGYIGEFGHFGAVIVAVVVTAIFILRDLRPDRFRLNP